MNQKIKVPDVKHSKRGASGADRWLNCPGSVNLTEKYYANKGWSAEQIQRSASWAADEGTAAHTIMALCLENDVDSWEYGGAIVVVGEREFEVDPEMVEGVQICIDLVRKLVEEYAEQGARVYVEKGLQSAFDEDGYGTPDILILVPGVKLIIIDFKYGRGIVVEPDSAQTRYYGALGLENLEGEASNLEDVDLWICQPRIWHRNGKCRRFSTKRTDIEKWFHGTVLPGMQATRDPDAHLEVGSWCRFCPARDICPAVQKDLSKLDPDLDPTYLTGDELGALLAKKTVFLKLFEGLEKEAFKRLRTGDSVDGKKLVRKKANRVFRDKITKEDPTTHKQIEVTFEEAAKEQFGDKAYVPPKFKSPAQMERLTKGKAFVQRWAYTPDAGYTVADDTDAREAVLITGHEVFGDLDFLD